MDRKWRSLEAVLLVLIFAVTADSASAGAAYTDPAGRAWLDVNDTKNFSWFDMAAICPQDGMSPCAGLLGGTNLTGWVWATRDQVRELARTITGLTTELDDYYHSDGQDGQPVNNSAWATALSVQFPATQMTGTCNSVFGLTSTTDPNATPPFPSYAPYGWGTWGWFRDCAVTSFSSDKIDINGNDGPGPKDYADPDTGGFFWKRTLDGGAVVDTGPGSAGPNGLILSGRDNLFGGAGFRQSLSGRITISRATTVDSVSGWMYVSRAPAGDMLGAASVAIHADAAGSVGASVFSRTFELQCAPVGCAQAEWKGASGLRWYLNPGTYWVVFSVPDGSAAGAVMPGSAPFPLPAYRFSAGAMGAWQALANIDQYRLGVRLLSASTPEAMLEQLATVVAAVGPGSSFADKVALAQTYYAVPDVQSACAIMTDFKNQVRAQSGKKLTAAVSNQLIADAQGIMDAMGCD